MLGKVGSGVCGEVFRIKYKPTGFIMAAKVSSTPHLGGGGGLVMGAWALSVCWVARLCVESCVGQLAVYVSLSLCGFGSVLSLAELYTTVDTWADLHKEITSALDNQIVPYWFSSLLHLRPSVYYVYVCMCVRMPC